MINFLKIGEHKIVCPNTPERNSYYCKNHLNTNAQLQFNFKGNMVHYNIQEIVSKTKKHIEYNDEINVEDCFVDKEDNVLYLISGTNEQIFWCEEKFVPKRLLDDFFIVYATRSQSEQLQLECRVQKDLVIPCLKKCRTTGVLLTVFNCGIICGYREIFSAESLSQVAIF